MASTIGYTPQELEDRIHREQIVRDALADLRSAHRKLVDLTYGATNRARSEHLATALTSLEDADLSVRRYVG